MTGQQAKPTKSFFGFLRKMRGRVPFLALGVLFAMLFFLRNAELAKSAVLLGLRRAALGVLPAVFPFLALSDLLVAAGGLPRVASAWLSFLFRLPSAAGAAILLGWICGFPVGAVYAAKETERGNLTPEEGGRAVAAASVPSPAFLIGVVGNGIFQSAATGVVLWLFCLLSATIVCAGAGIGRKREVKSPEKPIPSAAEPFFSALTRSVGNAAGIALNLCAFLAFFTVLTAAVQAVLAKFGAPTPLGAAAAALLELSGGVCSAATLPARWALPFCAAACGWAGFSVHLQIFSVCGRMRLRHKNYLFAKAVQAALCFAFAEVWQLLR